MSGPARRAFGSLMAAAGSASAAETTAHPGITHVRPGGAVHAFVPGGLMKKPSGALANSRGVKNQAESTNWSGYAVTGSSGAFSSVSSSWTEPAASCSGSSAQYAAFWVGLDGYNSGSVEQTGTDSDCNGSSPDYYGCPSPTSARSATAPPVPTGPRWAGRARPRSS